MPRENNYTKILNKIFFDRYTEDTCAVSFERDDIATTAQQLKLAVPRNLGDVIYSFRYRNLRPARIMETAPDGYTWVLRPEGRGLYKFALAPHTPIAPNPNLAITKVPDATPGIVGQYAVSDEAGIVGTPSLQSLDRHILRSCLLFVAEPFENNGPKHRSG